MTRMHRIYTDQPLRAGQVVTLTGDAAHYLSRVLRVGLGQDVVLFNGDGADYAAKVSRLDRAALILQLQSSMQACTESPLRITLVQAISRGERMDLTLQKATELGVAALQPVFTARTEVRLTEEKLDRRLQHWRKVLISACEQCGRARIPALESPVDLLAWAQQPSQALRIMLEPGAPGSLSRLPLRSDVELLVGPEGGFDDRETEFLGRHGLSAVSLGPRILRTETAGPAAIAIMQALAGDLAPATTV